MSVHVYMHRAKAPSSTDITHCKKNTCTHPQHMFFTVSMLVVYVLASQSEGHWEVHLRITSHIWGPHGEHFKWSVGKVRLLKSIPNGHRSPNSWKKSDRRKAVTNRPLWTPVQVCPILARDDWTRWEMLPMIVLKVEHLLLWFGRSWFCFPPHIYTVSPSTMRVVTKPCWRVVQLGCKKTLQSRVCIPL